MQMKRKWKKLSIDLHQDWDFKGILTRRAVTLESHLCPERDGRGAMEQLCCCIIKHFKNVGTSPFDPDYLPP